MRPAKSEPACATEAELCAAFIAALPKEWTAYPETGGCDILLVRKVDGLQIGVQAKLRLTAHVLLQALEGRWVTEGPDCRAVLVPANAAVAGIAGLADHLAITVVEVWGLQKHSYHDAFRPSLPDPAHRYRDDQWYELCPLRRLTLPEFVPDTKAGTPSPIQLTVWKIAAIKIAVMLERRGYVTRADFKAVGIDPRRWLDSGWLVAGPLGLVAGANMPKFKHQHPRNWDEIAADADKWMPRVATAAGLV